MSEYKRQVIWQDGTRRVTASVCDVRAERAYMFVETLRTDSMGCDSWMLARGRSRRYALEAAVVSLYNQLHATEASDE